MLLLYFILSSSGVKIFSSCCAVNPCYFIATLLLPDHGAKFYTQNEWFLIFFWSRTIRRSRTVITYHLVPGKLNLSNIIRSKVWRTRIDMAVTNYNDYFENQQRKYTEIQEIIKRTR